MGHESREGETVHRGIGQGKETKNLKWLICSQYRNEYRNLKQEGAAMRSGLGKSEED
jgi:hypothetical protein